MSGDGCPAVLACVLPDGRRGRERCGRNPGYGTAGLYCRRHGSLPDTEQIAMCSNPEHAHDCRALMMFSDITDASPTPTCSTRWTEYVGKYPEQASHFQVAPWPIDRPMWIYDGEHGEEFWIDPVTHVEVPAPDRTTLSVPPRPGFNRGSLTPSPKPSNVLQPALL